MSELEAKFLLQLRCTELPEPEREYRFHPPRRFRFDFAWVAQKIAVAIEGFGHHKLNRYGRDIEKYNLAALDGWCVIRVRRDELDDLSGIAMVEEALAEETQ